MPTWATACNTSEPTTTDGPVARALLMLAAGKSSAGDLPIQYTYTAGTAREPEYENVRSAFDYGKAVRSERRRPKALDTVARSSQCQPPRFGLERSDVGEQVTRDRASALGPASIRERCECERRQPTRSGSRTWFATGPWG